MNLDLHSSELLLADDVPIRLSSAKGVCLRCTAGTVWLTVEGETGDIFLRAGESYWLRSNGLALLEGLAADSRVRFRKMSSPWRAMMGRPLHWWRMLWPSSQNGACPRPTAA
ncbi:MAG: DUF2917 domain-containing protein [Candidatus Accumulibacter sp.]|nr:DUF2917 domain-containing protein [Accumulibacter sp.]